MEQLPLVLAPRNDATLNNFYVGHNQDLLAAMHDLLVKQSEPKLQQEPQLIYLWGRSGCGRSHLLQALCHLATLQQLTATYLPLSDHEQLAPEMLEGLEDFNIICIDDIQAIAGQSIWEEQLFHLYNRSKDQGHALCVASSAIPKLCGIALPDLISRLSWGLVYQLKTLSDEDKMLALQQRAELRGLQLNEQVAQFLLRHGPRDTKRLFALLAQLDRASLVAQRRLTVPFVKQVLGSLRESSDT